jgi:hypothetical protein
VSTIRDSISAREDGVTWGLGSWVGFLGDSASPPMWRTEPWMYAHHMDRLARTVLIQGNLGL